MTDIDAMRDELARLCGWTRPKRTHELDPVWTCDDGSFQDDHPFPPGDLTDLAAAWPKGWWISVEREGGEWCARGGIASSEWVYAAPTEYEARLRLTLAALKAERGGA